MLFIHPWVLLLLVPVWLTAGLWWLRQRRLRQRFRQGFTGAQHHNPSARRRSVAQFICLITALTLAITALARPRWGHAARITLRSPYDLLIAVDVSRSMLAEDISPNRLERAKLLLYDVIQHGGDDRIGLLAFRNGARVASPLTRDTRFLLLALDGLSIDSAPPGPSDLGRAIRDAIGAFPADPDRQRVALFVSDGDDLRGDMKAALELAATREARFLTVGIGSPRGAPIPLGEAAGGNQTYRGERIITRRVDETLSRLATDSGGAYLPMDGGSVDLTDFYRSSRPHDPDFAAILESIRNQPTERFQWFLMPAVILLLMTAGISHGRPVERPGIRSRSSGHRPLYGGIGLILCALIVPQAVPAADIGARLRAALHKRQADTLLKRGACRDAAETLDRSLETVPDAPQADRLHRAGYAWYRAGNTTTAVQRMEAALQGNPDPIVQYNLALARRQAALAPLQSATNPATLITWRQALERSAAALQAIPTTDADLPDSLRRRAVAALDATLRDLRDREAILRDITEYGELTQIARVNQLHQRQQGIYRETRAAAGMVLPQRLPKYRELASRQRDLTGITQTLLSSASDQPDADTLTTQLTGIMAAITKATDALDEADEDAPANVAHATKRIHDLWLAVGGDPPVREPDQAPPDNETVDEKDSEADRPRQLAGRPDGASAERPPDASGITDKNPDPELDADQLEFLLERIRHRETEYHQQRHRTIAPVVEGMDW